MRPMDDFLARGRAIRERIYQGQDRPQVKISVLAHEAVVGRDTVYKVMAGAAEEKSVRKVEAALDAIEQRPADYESEDYLPSEDEGLDVVELHGLYGVSRVIVRARPDRMEDEIAAVVRAIRRASLPDAD